MLEDVRGNNQIEQLVLPYDVSVMLTRPNVIRLTDNIFIQTMSFVLLQQSFASRLF